jgi:calcium/calmodulin-dependent protein kinase I
MNFEKVLSFLNFICSGAFSEVILARRIKTPSQNSNIKQDSYVAIKCIRHKALKGKEDALQNEISVLKKLKHPNIVQLLETFDDNQFVYIVMEL